jgi:hypothetical protein
MQELYNIANRMLSLNNSYLLVTTMSKNPSLKKLVTDLNTKKQLEYGELSNGEVLPNYSFNSQVFFGKPDKPIQLKDTGEFWRSFDVVLADDGFYINADGDKGDVDLFVKYSENVAGLNDKNMIIFIDALLIQFYNVILTFLTKQN